MTNLQSVSDAKQIMLSCVLPLGVENVLLEDAYDRVLAHDLYATIAMPYFNNSGMDGFVVRAIDVQDASDSNPVTLDVIGDIPAGIRPTLKLNPGEASRIVTGAYIPEGGDAVIPVESTDIKSFDPGSPLQKKVDVYCPVDEGGFIRPRGQDIKVDDLLLTKNIRLRPQDIGVLATQGIAQVAVYKRPCVGLISTGDELITVGTPLTPGKIYETNSYTISALINQSKCECRYYGTGADNTDAVRHLLHQAIEEKVDLILSTAGVSMGSYDFVRDVLIHDGILSFWKVNMRPGKPLAFGSYGGIPFIGLPGNPVSAFIGFEVFVKPLLDKMSGLGISQRLTHLVRLSESVTSDGRESYLRAILSRDDRGWHARLTGHQGSGNLLSLVQANGLIIIPSGVKSLAVGSEVEAWIFRE